MADQDGDKTEAPTPRKRQEAREQGQVAKSNDLVSSVSLLLAVIMLGWFGPAIKNGMETVVRESLSAQALADMNAGNVGTASLRLVVVAGLATMPIMFGMMVAAVLGNVLQTGLVISPQRLAPKIESLNPIKGFSKIFGGWPTLIQLGMNCLKLTIVALVGYSAVHSRLGAIVGAQQLDYTQIFGLVSSMVYQIALRVAVVLLVLAIIDYAWRKFKHERDLKMTKQEVKDEMKRMDGDPMIKQRRRQIAMKMSRDRQKAAVPTADVVVTNPTEYAIAIKYDPEKANAPRVVAKGKGLIAAEIRRLAIANGVPILERPPLARALFRLCDVGQEIPEQFFTTVAEILAYVYELTGKLKSGRMTANV